MNLEHLANARSENQTTSMQTTCVDLRSIDMQTETIACESFLDQGNQTEGVSSGTFAAQTDAKELFGCHSQTEEVQCSPNGCQTDSSEFESIGIQANIDLAELVSASSQTEVELDADDEKKRLVQESALLMVEMQSKQEGLQNLVATMSAEAETIKAWNLAASNLLQMVCRKAIDSGENTTEDVLETAKTAIERILIDNSQYQETKSK